MNAAKKLLKDFQAFESLEMSPEEYDYFSRKMYEYSGVNLPANDKNRALMKNRLARLLRRYSLHSYQELVQKMIKPTEQDISSFISALTTNKTDFFREPSHFEVLTKHLKSHFEKHSELRIWCAAASTGQEPYTIAMACAEALRPLDLKKTRILATDIDLQALQTAAEGFYSQQEMEGIPAQLQNKYFDDFAGQFRASSTLTSLISFCPFNLIKGPYLFKQPFHYAFCRNVLIYFDQKTCNLVIDGLLSCIATDGLLFLGHSESGVMKSPLALPMTGAVYKKKE